MSDEKKRETTKPADSLIKTTKKGETELTEEQLSRVGGGCDGSSKDPAYVKMKI